MARIHKYCTAAAVGLLLSSGLARTATAQTNASVQALAHVVGFAPLTASGVNDLQFGSVNAGSSGAPASLANNTGRFNISGQPSTPVTLTFSLPTDLTSGSNSIPITFGNNDGLLWNPWPTTHSTFNPNAAFITSLDGSGALTIGITGTVNPNSTAQTGDYSGTITLTVQY